VEAPLSSATNPGDIDEVLSQVDWVRGLVRRLLGEAREADIDDIVQDTMVQAISTPPRADRPVRGWLGTVARNLLYQRHRRASRRRKHEDQAPEQQRFLSPEESVLLAERQHVVVSAVLALPEPYRHTLLLYHFHGLTEEGIAEQLEVSRSTVQSRLRRGRDLLREDLQGRLGERWAVALLPLALWPERVPPVSPAPAPAGPRVPAWTAAALVVVTGVVAGVWWGDWNYDLSGSGEAAAVRTEALREELASRERRRVGVATSSGESSPESAATPTAGEAEETGLPEHPPDGSIRVRVVGLPEGLAVAPVLRVQRFHPTFGDRMKHGKPVPVTVPLDGDRMDVDLSRLTPVLDAVEADVTLFHPDLLPQRVRAQAAGPGDSGVDAVLHAVPAAIVAGRVLDAEGRGVAGAVVLGGVDAPAAGSRPHRSVADETRSGPDGSYRLRVPAGQPLKVLATASGHEAAWTPVTALAAGESVTADVELGRGHAISGRLRLPEDGDATRFRVRASLVRYQEPAFQGREAIGVLEDGRAIQVMTSAPVAADGTFVLRGLSPVAYRIGLEPNPGDPHRGREGVEIVREAPADGLDLDAVWGEVRFLVRDDGGPLAGVGVEAWELEGGALCGTRTDEAGEAVLALRPARTFRWRVVARSRAREEGEATAPASGDSADVEVTLGPAKDAGWRVRLQHADGRPVTKAAFSFRPLSEPGSAVGSIASSAADGEFELTGLARGPQRVTIRVGADWNDARSYWRDIPLEVNLPDGGPVPTVVLRERGGRLRIRIASEDGARIFARGTLTRDGREIPCKYSTRQYESARSTASTLTSLGPNDVQPVLEPGTYQLKVECVTYPPRPAFEREVTIREGETTDVEVTFPAR
jgi:RNA polymerase sigma-70 factor (ECF subfamily)